MKATKIGSWALALMVRSLVRTMRGVLAIASGIIMEGNDNSNDAPEGDTMSRFSWDTQNSTREGLVIAPY